MSTEPVKTTEDMLKTIDMESYDGVYFMKDSTGEKWDFSFMKIKNEEEKNFHTHPVGFIYKILHLTEKGADVFEAVIGDPNRYIKNMIACNQQGVIIRKCDKAEEVFSTIMKRIEGLNKK